MEQNVFIARVDDTADIAEREQKCKYLGFLTPEEAVAADKRLEKRTVRYGFFGGYSEAERRVLGCFPDWAETESYPITALSFAYRKTDKLSHRDFLGSLMALGIKRESVGDIIVSDGSAVVFVLTEIADYIMSQIDKIGRVGVKISLGFSGELSPKDRFEEYTKTVASPRLDCVVAAVCSLSRGDASEKISCDLVSVNSFTVNKITHTVNEGDIISVRGKGRFIIEALENRTRKNRFVLEYKKYT